jgi:hypothetical protein
MTPDVNLPKTVPPTPAKNPIANPGDRKPTHSSGPQTTPAQGNQPAARPPMATIPKPILPVAVPAPAKLTKGDASTCDSSAAPSKVPGKGDGKSGECCDSSKQGH